MDCDGPCDSDNRRDSGRSHGRKGYEGPWLWRAPIHIVGAIGGSLSGYFLQTTVINTNGVFSEPRQFERALLHGLTGAVAGGILMMIVGFLKHSLDAHRGLRSDAANLPTLAQTASLSGFSEKLTASTAGPRRHEMLPWAENLNREHRES